MKELSRSSTYIFWIGILDLLSVIFQDSSSYSLQILNLNFNLLLQSAHTHKKSQERSSTVPQRKVKLKNRNLGLWWGLVLGSRDCASRMPCPALVQMRKCSSRHLSPGYLKNVLFSVGPNALYGHGQNIYSCLFSVAVQLYNQKRAWGPSHRKIRLFCTMRLLMSFWFNPRGIKKQARHHTTKRYPYPLSFKGKNKLRCMEDMSHVLQRCLF